MQIIICQSNFLPIIQDKKVNRTALEAIEGCDSPNSSNKQANWLTAVDLQNGVLCFGDVSGQISVQKQENRLRKTQKVYKDITPKFLLCFYIIMSTPLGGGYIIFAFSAVRCPASRMVSAHLKEKY